MKRADLLNPTGRGLSRRNLLHGASVGIGASMLGALFPNRSRAEQGGQNNPTLGIVRPSLASMPVAWSNDEFHRRWNALRKRMKEAKLDCLIVPQNYRSSVLDAYKTEADVNWLSGIPAGWVVFPIEGKITVIVDNERLNTHLKDKRPVPGMIMTTLLADNSPDIEVRYAREEMERGAWSPTIIDVLREKKMEQARIGVGSLVGVPRNPEGSVSHTTYTRVSKAFPQAQFENAVDMLWQVKLINSAEEIAVFEKVAAVSEAGLLAMLETARPGAVNRDVWLSMYGTMLECSGSVPQHLVIATKGMAGVNLGCPLPDIIEAGQILNQECAACGLGFGTQVNHSVLIGSEGPADWPSAAGYCIDTFHALLDQIAPGKNIKEVVDFYIQRLGERGEHVAHDVNFHFDGYGDLPRIGPGLEEVPEDTVFQAGMIFDLKPEISIKGTPMRAQFGDPVVVTEKGARRLGKRRLEIVHLA
jgi:Xaa-Pro aminopeptidase